MSERIAKVLSRAELERRWTALRAAMARAELDVLVVYGNNDHMGGYVRYVTGVPAMNGYPVTVILPKDDDMTVILQGPYGVDRETNPAGDGIFLGVRRVLTVSSWASSAITQRQDIAAMERALLPFSRATIGLVGPIPFVWVDHLRCGALREARFSEASNVMDGVRAVKSSEEQALIRDAAAIQDGAMRAILEAIGPGQREVDLVSVAEAFGRVHGSEQGLFLTGSGPRGYPTTMNNRHAQNRPLKNGDQFHILLEMNGPGGMYTELGRTVVLGVATDEMHAEFEFVMRARAFTLDLLRPGAEPAVIWAEYNAFLRGHGRPEERRVHCHGQGYDMVERPIIRFDEAMPLGAGMNLSLHPTYSTAHGTHWICDNFLVSEGASPERLHSFPEKIIEIAASSPRSPSTTVKKRR